ncbi:hypothetical protein [Burkholderia phage BCSR52]|uniref:Uncharacterized protein n=1 Tax=Burkholderia phage BCSR52 TaxID=2805748 RepID=A0A889IQ20_9CAUD|nr:hypothetical protein [Burkholderia phage BCSR52]
MTHIYQQFAGGVLVHAETGIRSGEATGEKILEKTLEPETPPEQKEIPPSVAGTVEPLPASTSKKTAAKSDAADTPNDAS